MGHAWLILVENIPFSSDNLVIFRPISMKLDMWVDINPNLSLLKYWYAWVTLGRAWLILVEKIAFSNDNLVIFRPILIKLEMCVDINPNFESIEILICMDDYRLRLTDFSRKSCFLWQ